MTVRATYGLSDLLLFSPDTYYRLFELTNRDVWPLQVLMLLLGIALLFVVLRRPAWQGRFAAAVLAASWLGVAWIYHWQRYAAINWAAPWFAACFALEALLMIWAGIFRNRLLREPISPALRRTGLVLYGFALLLYPLVNPLLGHGWTQVELFGIAPDPTVMATLGILLTSNRKRLWILMIIPACWCAVSGATLWAMAAPNALITPFAAILVVLFLAVSGKR